MLAKMINGVILASIPLLFPCYILIQLLFINNTGNNPFQTILTWITRFIAVSFTLPGERSSSNDLLGNNNGQDTTVTSASATSAANIIIHPPPVSSQLLAYVIVAALGYWATDCLIPIIKKYTLRKGISGKDLGKRGTKLGHNDV